MVGTTSSSVIVICEICMCKCIKAYVRSIPQLTIMADHKHTHKRSFFSSINSQDLVCDTWQDHKPCHILSKANYNTEYDEIMMRRTEEKERDRCCKGQVWHCTIQVQRKKMWSCWRRVALLINFGKWLMSRLRFLCRVLVMLIHFILKTTEFPFVQMYTD